VKRRVALLTVMATLALIGATNVPAGAGPGGSAAGTTARLQMYTVVADQAGAKAIKAGGYDIASVERAPGGGVRLEIVAYPSQLPALEKFGTVELWRNDAGLTSTQLAVQQASAGFKVWRDYDGPDGLRQYMYDLEAANEDILDLEVFGHTYGTDPEGDGPDTPREIIALRLTANEGASADGSKPAVLYSSTIHAREWIATEVNRRLLEWFIKGWREEKPDVVDILDSSELWFVLVQNPDGYQYTFDVDRLWRKNLRDNDGDNEITSLDGVDGNRNFAEHWNYDDEGSGTITSDETYRGPAPFSEPETRAIRDLLIDIHPTYHISYHSFGQLLLYPFGFQVNTPSADDPIYVAWAGTDKKPAVQGYNPGVGADLYTTNGEQTDYAAAVQGSLAITPELGEGNQENGFEFPDSEGEIQHEFLINKDFAVAAARSATDPDNPVSPVNINTQPFYLNMANVDPQKSFNPMSDFTFAHSYNGASQPVQVLARRDLDNDGDQDQVTLNYSINGGATHTASTNEWDGGDRYGGPGDTYYRIVRGNVTGAAAGNDVKVWFTGAGKTSDSFTFHVDKTNANDVLILADTDYSGPSNFPAYTAADGAPPFLTAYTDAVTASGRTYDVYDVDAMGAAPDHLGVLGHYDAVVWYTANDLVSRVAGQPGGTGAETQANTMMLQVRAYLNEGGRILYTGRHAGWEFANAFVYNPVSTPPLCQTNNLDPAVDDGCLALSDDFLQYWLGAYIFVEDGGTDRGDPETTDDDVAFPMAGSDVPFAGAASSPWTIEQTFAAGRDATTQSFITTSSILKTDTYPQFTSTAPGEWVTGIAGPYEPHSPTHYVYSQRADVRYQRLMKSFTVGGDNQFSFQVSYDTEPEWDFVFVELQDEDGNWVTLPEENGNTQGGTPASTGQSCPEGWFELHPWLEQYEGAGCTGEGWNAASGRSAGWTKWEFDLSAYAGQNVTVSISYASDWATQGLGVWIDDVQVPGAPLTDFESGLDGWTVGDPTEIGSDINPLDWNLTTDVGFTEGAITSMNPGDADFRTLYFGFGFENVAGTDERNEMMDLALDYLT
jgi:Zinc carboxypeptidase/Immune inhibitor A-like, MAM domain